VRCFLLSTIRSLWIYRPATFCLIECLVDTAPPLTNSPLFSNCLLYPSRQFGRNVKRAFSLYFVFRGSPSLGELRRCARPHEEAFSSSRPRIPFLGLRMLAVYCLCSDEPSAVHDGGSAAFPEQLSPLFPVTFGLNRVPGRFTELDDSLSIFYN